MLRAESKTIKSPIKPGTYFLQGNEACGDGAYIAGCRFFGGYPITPSSEIMRRICERFLEFGDGVFVQMEDEIGSMSTVIGAAWTGVKAMTATSGPGISLMMESIGYAIMTETPCVIMNIQRAGPSTGQATRPSQSDIQQARWGNHGGYPIIALCPSTAQEYLEQTIRAFNLAEAFRVPVIILGDEVIGHARERVVINQEYDLLTRYYKKGEPLFDTDNESLVPAMPKFGDGEKMMVTGSTHAPDGFRKASCSQTQNRLTWRFTEKINRHRDLIVQTRDYHVDDADIVYITFGATYRTTMAVTKRLIEDGKKVGLLKIDTIWPMAEKQILALDIPGKKIVVPEMNNGQYVREVKRLVKHAEVFSFTQENGEAIKPDALAFFTEGLL